MRGAMLVKIEDRGSMMERIEDGGWRIEDRKTLSSADLDQSM
jgi:hypothetical protein